MDVSEFAEAESNMMDLIHEYEQYNNADLSDSQLDNYADEDPTGDAGAEELVENF